MHVYVRDNEELDQEQKRIIEKAIKSFERN
jgi:hypothetical protein